MSAPEAEVVKSFTAQAERLATSEHLTASEPLQMFLEVLPLRPSDRVLDIGCGCGALSFAIAPHCHSVSGIDLTPALVARAIAAARETHCDNARFSVADARELDFPDGSFDAVVSRLALHHMPDPVAVIEAAVRVARPGGVLAIFDMLTSENPAQAEQHNRFQKLRDPSHARALPLSELLHCSGLAGFELTALRVLEFEFDLADYIAKVDQSSAEAGAARRLLAAHLGRPTYLGRRLRVNASGQWHYSARWGISVSRRVDFQP